MRSLLPRLGRLVVVLFLVTLFASLLVSFLPGDPAAVVAPFASDQQRAEIADELGGALAWSPERRQGEIDAYRALVRAHRPG